MRRSIHSLNFKRTHQLTFNHSGRAASANMFTKQRLVNCNSAKATNLVPEARVDSSSFLTNSPQPKGAEQFSAFVFFEPQQLNWSLSKVPKLSSSSDRKGDLLNCLPECRGTIWRSQCELHMLLDTRSARAETETSKASDDST